MTTARRWRRTAIVLGVSLGSAILGAGAAPHHAEAAAPAVFHWSCTSADKCGAGSRECCKEYDHCSTMCDIIVT